MREDRVTHKILEGIRGLLIYVAMNLKMDDAIPEGHASDY